MLYILVKAHLHVIKVVCLCMSSFVLSLSHFLHIRFSASHLLEGVQPSLTPSMTTGNFLSSLPSHLFFSLFVFLFALPSISVSYEMKSCFWQACPGHTGHDFRGSSRRHGSCGRHLSTQTGIILLIVPKNTDQTTDQKLSN